MGCCVALLQGVSKGFMEKGLGHGKQGVEKEQAWLAPREVTSRFGHLSPLPGFTLPWKGGCRGLYGMQGMGAGGLIPLHPTRSREVKPHKHPLVPPHSCSNSCNMGQQQPLPITCKAKFGGGRDQPTLLWSWGTALGVTPILCPPGTQQCQQTHPAPWARPLCSAQALHRRALCRWAHPQLRRGPAPVLATSIK